MKAQDFLFGNLEYGDDIQTAKNMVRYTCGGYVAFPVTVVVCIIFSLIGWDNVFRWKDGIIGISAVLIVAVIISVSVSKLTRTIEDLHIYISSFNEFRKRDKKWHKKWKIYTILLSIGSILSAIISFKFGLLCIDLTRNIHGSFH